MRVEYIVEHEDGGATIKFDLEHEEVQGLLSYALKTLLTQAAQEVVDESTR
jgi:ribosome-associated toxin RatA of RatAB toxin-antitoxin module